MSHFPYADFFPVPEKKEVLCTLSGHEKQDELVPLQVIWHRKGCGWEYISSS